MNLTAKGLTAAPRHHEQRDGGRGGELGSDRDGAYSWLRGVPDSVPEAGAEQSAYLGLSANRGADPRFAKDRL
jgi:hypothetical protein